MSPVGKYFQLISKLSGHALGVNRADGTQATANASVVTCNRNEVDDYQIWYEDKSTGTIRIKANGLCLHIADDNVLRLHPVDAGQSGQKWTFSGDRVQNRNDAGKVLDICGSNAEPGASVCSWDFHGGPNQLWDQVTLPPKFFYLKSELNGKVLDIDGGNPEPGSKLCMWDQKPVDEASNQLWYEDQNGVIRSCLNDFVIDAADSQEMAMQPINENSAATQSWVIHGSYIALEPKRDRVLDIVGSNAEDGARICVWEAHGNANQKWIAEYI